MKKMEIKIDFVAALWDFAAAFWVILLSRMYPNDFQVIFLLLVLFSKVSVSPYLANIHVKEETQLVIFDEFPALSGFVNLPCILSYLRIDESSNGTFAKVVKKDSISKFFKRGGSSRFTENHIVGYCNGVFLSSQAHSRGTTLVVIYPRKEACYELPSTEYWSDDLGVSYVHGLDFDDATECYDGPLPKTWPRASKVFYSCGLGLDDSTMTYKIVCIMRKERFDEATNEFMVEFCTLVHVFGTSSWREIPNPPCYRTMTNEGVFVHGCLHWYTLFPHKIVRFDVKKETFKLIDPPKYIKKNCANNQLVDLHGELGLVYHADNVSMEVWLLKKNEWMLHCKLDRKHPIPDDCQVMIKVLGCGNKDGEIFMTADPAMGEKRLLVYNSKRDVLKQVKVISREHKCKSEIRLTCV